MTDEPVDYDDLSIDDVLDAPLDRKRIVVTRPREQASELTNLLVRLGADVIHMPVIEIADPPSWDELDWSIKKLAEGFYTWVLFTSANAVTKFFDRLSAAERDARTFGRTRIGVVGSATEKALRQRAILADLVPTEFTGTALADAIGRGSGRVLIPRVSGAPGELVKKLSSNGWKCDSVVAYVNLQARDDSPEAEQVRSGKFDAVTFASGSAVRGFVGMAGAPEDLGLAENDPGGRVVACIGPSTAEAAKELGFRVDILPQEHTSLGLATALANEFRGMGT